MEIGELLIILDALDCREEGYKHKELELPTNPLC